MPHRVAPQVLEVGQEPAPLETAIMPRPAGKAAFAKRKVPTTSGNRFSVFNAFVDVTMAGLSRAEMAVWLLLYRDTKRDGLARTAQADLARRAGTTPRSVERAVRSLEHAGLLTVVYRGGLRKGSSIYRVHPLTKEQLAPPHPDRDVGL